MVLVGDSILNILDGENPEERLKWWRLSDPGAPELLHASFRTRRFSRHAHDRLAVGVIEAGGLAFRYRGQEVVAPAGWVNFAFPGEVHCGHGLGPEGWTYRMFYLDPVHALAMARALDSSLLELPFIPAGAVWDPELAGIITKLHIRCADPAADPLGRQEGLGLLVMRVLRRYGAVKPQPLSTRLREAVHAARQWLEDGAERPITLEELAAVTRMNPFTLVRAFAREWGVTPHAYLVQARVNRAAALLRKGESPARAAVESGFADQSHLNRHFLRHFGVTPGVYRCARRGGVPTPSLS
jgi:AraC-like DNA-binding protein